MATKATEYGGYYKKKNIQLSSYSATKTNEGFYFFVENIKLTSYQGYQGYQATTQLIKCWIHFD